jgi:predicted esterase YcpF (UPF0227 family)
MRLKTLLLIPIIALSMVGFLPAAHAQYAQSSTQREEEILGTIEEINYDTSMVVLKSYKDEASTTHEDVTLYVREESIIEKDGQRLEFKDLSKGDKLVIKYKISSDGGKEAVHIWRK